MDLFFRITNSGQSCNEADANCGLLTFIPLTLTQWHGLPFILLTLM